MSVVKLRKRLLRGGCLRLVFLVVTVIVVVLALLCINFYAPR